MNPTQLRLFKKGHQLVKPPEVNLQLGISFFSLGADNGQLAVRAESIDETTKFAVSPVDPTPVAAVMSPAPAPAVAGHVETVSSRKQTL